MSSATPGTMPAAASASVPAPPCTAPVAASAPAAAPSIGVRAALRGIAWYRRVLAPTLGGRCRFEPSCSCYAEQALRTHGLARGAMLAIGRVLRCGPWSRCGPDPVPPAPQRTARRSTSR